MFTKKTKSGVSNALKQISRSFYNDAFAIIAKGMTDTVLEAKAVHRFKPQTGNLERSIVSEMQRAGTIIQGKVMLKDSIADYGYWVTKGHGTWSSDPFLANAKDKHFPLIKNRIKVLLKKLMR